MPRGRSSSRGRSYGGGGFSRGSYSSPGRSYSPRSGSYSQSRGSTAYTRPPVSNTTSQARASPLGGGGLGSTIAHGMAFGGGSAIAHHAIGSMMGGGPYREKPMMEGQGGTSDPYVAGNTTPMQEDINNTKTNPCFDYSTKFVDCIRSVDELAKCQNIFDELKQCEKNMNI
jgi:hypothetical protein